MKIQAISDTHGQSFLNKIEPCGILLHCGDICPDYNGKNAVELQRNWFHSVLVKDLEQIQAKYIVFIGGNHDSYLEKLMLDDKEEDFRKMLPSNVFYLRDSQVTIDGIKIYGTPWVTNLKGWPFNRSEHLLENTYSLMPDGIDILLSHAPAHGYCDTIMEYGLTEHVGGVSLAKAINTKRPKRVFNGHIHSGDHNSIFNERKDVAFTNVSLLDESYKFFYKPFVFEI